MLWEYGPAGDDDDIYHDEKLWTDTIVPGAAAMWEKTWTPPAGNAWRVNLQP
jgi:hypothetical protein